MKWLFFLCLAVAVAATAEDLWRRRVSNLITLGALVSGIAAHFVLFGWAGVWNSVQGCFFGFLVFLIFFLMGGMGGGDIKLMAGFGAIVGGERIWVAAVLVGMIGGLMAILFLLGRTVLRWFRPAAPEPTSAPLRKAMIPYAPAISLGMLLTIGAELFE
jgi:prepilin peptidase CpaA